MRLPTSDPPPLIEYGSAMNELTGDRFLRRVVAWVAIIYSGAELSTTALMIALSRGWVASPKTMGWGFNGGWSLVVLAAESLAMVTMLVGGALLLRGSRSSPVLLRFSACGSIVLSFLSIALTFRSTPVYASYWSTPAAAGVNALQLLRSECGPALIALLTMPPLARRIV